LVGPDHSDRHGTCLAQHRANGARCVDAGPSQLPYLCIGERVVHGAEAQPHRQAPAAFGTP